MTKDTTGRSSGKSILPKILAVDDDEMILAFYAAVLSSNYEVHTVESGAEALEVCQMIKPDLILLDVEMPGFNGYDTCIKLRELTPAPIVFATAHQTMEEQLKAFDAGGDDILSKPLIPEILLRKVALAIGHKHAQEKLIEEKASWQGVAMNTLSSVGESGVMLNFVRGSLACRSFADLAQKLADALVELGLIGSVVLRHGGNNTYITTHGEPTTLEISILERSSSMGRIFQFKRNMVVNFDQISIVVSNMPENSTEKEGRIRDNIVILAEAAEAFCENIEMRIVSMERAENMQIALFEATKTIEGIRDKQMHLLMEVRVLLHGLTDKVEASYSELGTTQSQERVISGAMNDSVQNILEVLATGNKINDQFDAIVTTLKGGEKNSDIDLF